MPDTITQLNAKDIRCLLLIVEDASKSVVTADIAAEFKDEVQTVYYRLALKLTELLKTAP